MEFTAQQIAEFLQGKVEGDKTVKVSSFSKIEAGVPGTLTFLSNPKYEEYIYNTKASVVLVNDSFNPKQAIPTTLIRVKNSYSALAALLELADTVINPKKKGIDSLAVIPENAVIGEDAYVGAYAVIGENVKIGKGVQIYPQVYVGDNVVIGDNVTLYSGVKVYKNCVIGNNVIIHSGAVIGSDGFGFAPDEKGIYHKIPQLGNVVIEDDVEIGSNTCIDRSSMDGHTLLKKGVKLDNLIQIAHNVTVGENTVMAAQVGIAGSTEIGQRCMFGGQSGIVGHLRIGDGTIMAARAAMMKNTTEPCSWEGAPALPSAQFKRSFIHFKDLPNIVKEMRDLKNEIAELKKQLKKD